MGLSHYIWSVEFSNGPHNTYDSLSHPLQTMPKKHKMSGLSGLELELVYQSLKSLQNTVFEDQELSADDDGKPDFAEVLTDLLGMMRARLDGPQVWPSADGDPPYRSVQDISFSSLTHDHLSRLNILWATDLRLKPDLAEQVKKIQVVGKDDIWSSENLYCHLQRLQMLVPKSVSNRHLFVRRSSHVGTTRMKQPLALG